MGFTNGIRAKFQNLDSRAYSPLRLKTENPEILREVTRETQEEKGEKHS
jgi:predicted phage-related endonuclease